MRLALKHQSNMADETGRKLTQSLINFELFWEFAWWIQLKSLNIDRKQFQNKTAFNVLCSVCYLPIFNDIFRNRSQFSYQRVFIDSILLYVCGSISITYKICYDNLSDWIAISFIEWCYQQLCHCRWVSLGHLPCD